MFSFFHVSVFLLFLILIWYHQQNLPTFVVLALYMLRPSSTNPITNDEIACLLFSVLSVSVFVFWDPFVSWSNSNIARISAYLFFSVHVAIRIILGIALSYVAG